MCRGEKLPSPADLIDTVRDVVADLGLTIVIEPVRRTSPCTSPLVSPLRWPGSVTRGFSKPKEVVLAAETVLPALRGRGAPWWPTRPRWSTR